MALIIFLLSPSLLVRGANSAFGPESWWVQNKDVDTGLLVRLLPHILNSARASQNQLETQRITPFPHPEPDRPC